MFHVTLLISINDTPPSVLYASDPNLTHFYACDPNHILFKSTYAFLKWISLKLGIKKVKLDRVSNTVLLDEKKFVIIEIRTHDLPISIIRCLAVCWRPCQYFQWRNCSSSGLPSPKTTDTTDLTLVDRCFHAVWPTSRRLIA